MITQTLNLEGFLQPAIADIKLKLETELNRIALDIVRQEVAKFSLTLYSFISYERVGSNLIITIHQNPKRRIK